MKMLLKSFVHSKKILIVNKPGLHVQKSTKCNLITNIKPNIYCGLPDPAYKKKWKFHLMNSKVHF